jgi:hypothetical protein
MPELTMTDGTPESPQPPPRDSAPIVSSPQWRPRRSHKWWVSAGPVVAAILIPSFTVAATGCDSTPDLGTATAAPATDAPTLLLPPTDPPVPTVDPNASTGGSVFPCARVIITSCVNHPSQATMDPITGGVGTVFTLTGTITNTGTTTNDYVAIAILATAGQLNFGSADSFAVSLLPPGSDAVLEDPGPRHKQPNPAADLLSHQCAKPTRLTPGPAFPAVFARS